MARPLFIGFHHSILVRSLKTPSSPGWVKPAALPRRTSGWQRADYVLILKDDSCGRSAIVLRFGFGGFGGGYVVCGG
jgi:hypothetical protein